ncbi:MAG TPA: outer membrane lipoprotein carrier protein LolA [Saprospiraceae bacterium]|nr:outer membrane lipoprotein carrier protein LolA [Saprospiraceae bacterium]
MKQSILFILAITISISLFSQAESSDPKAKVLLDKVKKQFTGYKTVQIDFSIETESGEHKKSSEKGQLIQSGKNYRVALNSLTSFSDGKSVWTYLKKNKEIQVTNAGSKEVAPFVSPQEMINIYQNKEFIYAITNESKQANGTITEIEFKPTTKRTDYFKIRLQVNNKTLQITEAIAFYKDGTRQTIKISKLTNNPSVPASTFTYDAKEWPGIHVEDLRVD